MTNLSLQTLQRFATMSNLVASKIVYVFIFNEDENVVDLSTTSNLKNTFYNAKKKNLLDFALDFLNSGKPLDEFAVKEKYEGRIVFYIASESKFFIYYFDSENFFTGSVLTVFVLIFVILSYFFVSFLVSRGIRETYV